MVQDDGKVKKEIKQKNDFKKYKKSPEKKIKGWLPGIYTYEQDFFFIQWKKKF